MAMRQLKIQKSITNRESQALDKYLQEIGKISMITPEEELNLAQKIKAGDQQALDKLVSANLRFVVSVAKQYQNQGMTLPDLINEGNLGIMKAGQRYDETRGFKFISYAVWWIRQSILQALAENSRIVRLPQNKVGLTNRINRAYSELEQNFEREPTIEELAEFTDLDPRDVDELLINNMRHQSLDAPIYETEDISFGDLLKSGDIADIELDIESQKTDIGRAIDKLSKYKLKWAEVVIAFYGLNGNVPMSLEEIGEKYDLSKERVRQIKEKAVGRLKRDLNGGKLLKKYLG